MTYVTRPSRKKKHGATGVMLAFGLLVASGLTLGCTKQIQAPPDTALKHARHDLPEKPPHEVEPYPELIAPPPAYGNKVVMAEVDSTVDSF